MTFPVTNSGGININEMLATADIQTLIQMIQSERVQLMDQQLVEQIKTVQGRNDQIARYNNVLSELNAAAARFSSTSPTAKLSDTGGWKTTEPHVTTGKPVTQGTNVRDSIGMALGAAGLDSKELLKATFQATEKGGSGSIDSVTKGQIDAAITKIKGLIDAESNTQQTDMLRLQSLGNKRNESVEVLTSTQKKHSDANSNIIRNF